MILNVVLVAMVITYKTMHKDVSCQYITLCRFLAVFDVPMEKRGKLIGMGGHRIKAIAEETETVVESVDEEKMSIFAPSQEAMEEARERVDAILNEVEPKVRVFHVLYVLE